MAQVAVLGAGMAGLAAAQRCRQLGATVDVYERQRYVGGHAHSQTIDGFTFDEGPHVSFTKNSAIKELFAAAVGGRYREFASSVTNYWRGHWVKHPAQVNLFGLPVDLVARCLVDFIQVVADDGPIRTYQDWLYRQFGKTFSEEFPFRYTRKYWTVAPEQMATDWVGPRMYKPKLEEVIRGALAPSEVNHHYITSFRYPTSGGFASYVSAVADGQEVHLGHDLLGVDLKRKELTFANGRRVSYDMLISSLPLPELIRRVASAPDDVRKAAERLVCTSLVLVDVGVRRDEGFPDAHWLYFYDEDVVFSRVSFPHVLAPSNAPPGCGSIQVEIYHSRFAGLPCADVLSRAIDDLKRVSILRPDDEIIYTRERRVPYANVLYNHERASSLAAVQGFLRDHSVACCGRYGLWGYHWTDESIVSGWEAAELVLSQRQARS
jgi:protoporphyrinogen oxidase